MSSSVTSRIARSTVVLTIATGLSRILGLVRDLLIAQLFGTRAAAQAFVVAFRLPNLLRDLVAEGAVTSAFVPVLSWYRAKRDADEFWRLSQTLVTRLLVLLSGLGLLGVLGAPVIVRIIAPGFAEDPEKLALTVQLTRLLFPFIILVGLWAYFMGLLNSLQHFAAPALGPAILNVAIIVACVWIVPMVQPGILGVVYGVMVGAVLQLLIQIPVARHLGFRWRWRWHHPGSSEVLRLLGPRTVGAAVYRGNVLVHTALASLAGIVGEGAVAALYFADRLVQLPLALFGSASAQASLPSLVEQAAQNDLRAFRETLLTVLRMAAFVILPSAVGLIVLAVPIVQGLFERGAFDHRSTIMTSQALICYSLGLLAYAGNKIVSGAFYALRDTWTPVKLAIEAVAVNIILSLCLMWSLQIVGLALSAACANTLNTMRLLRRLEHRLGEPLVQPLVAPVGRMLVASVLMGLACAFLWTVGGLGQHPLLGLGLVIFLGFILYLGISLAIRVQECSTVLQWMRKHPLGQLFSSE